MSTPRYCSGMGRDIQVQWAIAKVMREARKKAGLTQVQLADFAGLSAAFVSDIERGLIGVSIAALLQLADVLKVDGAELMRRIEQEVRRGPAEPEPVTGRPRKT